MHAYKLNPVADEVGAFCMPVQGAQVHTLQDAPTWRPIRVLLANDCQTQRDMEVSHLLQNGFEARGLSTRTELIQAMPWPDLVVINMGNANGSPFALVEDIRKMSSRVGVLLVVPIDNSDYRFRAFLSGADDYLARPYEFKMLLVILQNMSRWHKQSINGIRPGKPPLL